MGQYWKLVNLDKKEFVHPHVVGAGLKLWEQLANHPGTGAALIVLCAAMPDPRGGGDFDLDANWHGPERTFPEHNGTPGPMPEAYPDIAKRTIGRWAGDRIALVGDYAESGDLPRKKGDLPANKIYGACQDKTKEVYNDSPVGASHRMASECTLNGKRHPHAGQYCHYKVVRPAKFRDISLDVAAVIEHELGGKYEGTGWRQWKDSDEVAKGA